MMGRLSLGGRMKRYLIYLFLTPLRLLRLADAGEMCECGKRAPKGEYECDDCWTERQV